MAGANVICHGTAEILRHAYSHHRGPGVMLDMANVGPDELFEVSLGEADVVTMFLAPAVNLRLRPRLLAELRPGARVVSHAFDMGDWKPEQTRRLGGAVVYRWTILH